jgi:hypothetical protein
MPVHHQSVVLDREAALFGHRALPRFDSFIQELFHVAAVKADDVIVVRAGVEFEYREPAVEVLPAHQAGGLELRKHAIDGCEPEVLMLIAEPPMDFLGRQVPRLRTFEDLQDAQPRQRYLESGIA